MGVTLVDVESGQALPDHTVLIAGDRIQRVGARAQVEVPINLDRLSLDDVLRKAQMAAPAQ